LDNDSLILENIGFSSFFNISEKDKRKRHPHKGADAENRDNHPVFDESATISARFAGSYRKSVNFTVSIPVAEATA
jgi:hypothetical protein